MHPEGVLCELVAQPPLGLARTPTEVYGPGLALDGSDNNPRRVAARHQVLPLGDDNGDVAGAAFGLAARDNEPNRAEVDVLLELGELAGLPPAEAQAKVAEPAEEVVGPLLVYRVIEQRLHRLPLRQLLDGGLRPPDPRQVDARQVAEVMRVDVAEGAAAPRLVALVGRLVHCQPVDDGEQLGAQLVGRSPLAPGRLARLIQRVRIGKVNAPRHCAGLARHDDGWQRPSRHGRGRVHGNGLDARRGLQKIRECEAVEVRAQDARLDFEEPVDLLVRDSLHELAVGQLGLDDAAGLARLVAQVKRSLLYVNLEDFPRSLDGRGLCHQCGANRTVRRPVGRRRLRPDDRGFGHDDSVRETQELEEVLAVEFSGAILEALLEPFARDEAAGVIGDGDCRHLHVGELRPALQAGARLRVAQLADGLREAVDEDGVVLLQEVGRLGLEELQVELKDAVAVTELVRVLYGPLEAGDELRHVEERLPCDAEHLLPVRPGDQLALILGEGAPAAATRLGVNGIADAQLENAVDAEVSLAQGGPDVAGLLAGNGREHVERERRAMQRGLDLGTELLFEPEDVFCVGHFVLQG